MLALRRPMLPRCSASYPGGNIDNKQANAALKNLKKQAHNSAALSQVEKVLEAAEAEQNSESAAAKTQAAEANKQATASLGLPLC